VVTFGTAASRAWESFTRSPAGPGATVFQQRALHPTADKEGGPITRADLLANWNVALRRLHAAIRRPDVSRPLVPYGDDFTAAELPEIPSRDLPMGLPRWMRGTDFWATVGAPPGPERANISV